MENGKKQYRNTPRHILFIHFIKNKNTEKLFFVRVCMPILFLPQVALTHRRNITMSTPLNRSKKWGKNCQIFYFLFKICHYCKFCFMRYDIIECFFSLKNALQNLSVAFWGENQFIAFPFILMSKDNNNDNNNNNI